MKATSILKTNIGVKVMTNIGEKTEEIYNKCEKIFSEDCQTDVTVNEVNVIVRPHDKAEEFGELKDYIIDSEIVPVEDYILNTIEKHEFSAEERYSAIKDVIFYKEFNLVFAVERFGDFGGVLILDDNNVIIDRIRYM